MYTTAINTGLYQTYMIDVVQVKQFTLTCIMLDKTIGSIPTGNRNKLNNAMPTKALSTVRELPDRTYVANVVNET